MESKKINQLATNLSPVSTDLTVLGDPTTGELKKITLQQIASLFGNITSIGMVVPSGFSVSPATLTASGTFTIAGAGTTAQYIRGDGSLATFPTLLASDSLIQEVRNNSGSTMLKGTIVYINGAVGNKATIAKALATTDALSSQTYGVVQDDITNNSNGYVVVVGEVTGLNTSALTEGQQLYLSGTVAGYYTTTKPYAPIHLVYVAIVLRSHPTLGVLGVKIQNGYEMDELHNVSAQSPSNNDGLFYNSSTSLWSKNTIAGVLGYTPFNLPSLTSGSVLFSDGTTISQNNANFFWDNGGGRLGIGTISPLFGIHCTSSIRGNALFSATNLTVGATTAATTSSIVDIISTTKGVLFPRMTNAQLTAIATPATGLIAYATDATEGLYVKLSGGFQRFLTTTDGSLYTADGTLTSARTVTSGGFNLTFVGATYSNRFTSTGRLLLGTTTESTFQLDVVGSARVTGGVTTTGSSAGYSFHRRDTSAYVGGWYSAAGNITLDMTVAGSVLEFAITTGIATFNNSLIVSKNQNADTSLTVSNTTGGTASATSMVLTTNSGSSMKFGKYSTSTTAYKTIASGDAYIYNGAVGDITFLNDISTGKIKFSAGASSTAQMTLSSSGVLSIGTTSPNVSAITQIDSTTKGFLPPRMTTTQKNAIATPAAGLMVYDSTLNKLCVYTTAWETITSL